MKQASRRPKMMEINWTAGLLIIVSLLLVVAPATGYSQSTPPLPQQQQVPVPTQPAADLAFSTPVAVGPASPLYVEWPKLVTERDGSLSALYSWGYRDHVFYVHSSDNGRTWSSPEDVGGNPLWGGSAGNISVAADREGRLHGCWYELYGPVYPSIHCRIRSKAGVWGPTAAVPGSGGERMKVTSMNVDSGGRTYVLAGKSARSLYLYALSDAGYSPPVNLPLTKDSQPSPSWLPEIGMAKGGSMVLLYGDHTLGGYNIRSLWLSGRGGTGAGEEWHSHYFSETDAAGLYTNGAQQYRMSSVALAEGGLGLAFECRLSDAEDKDICYREWQPNRHGLQYSGWQTNTVRFVTPPAQTVAPELCIDERGQRYLVWMDSYANMQVLVSWSRDGKQWSEPMRVNGGAYAREKHPSCAVSQGRLHVLWTDKISGDARLYYASRSLPELYPPLPLTSITSTGK